MRLEEVGIDRNEKISFLMSKDLTLAKENDRIIDVFKKILDTGHRRIPIVNKKGELIGIVTITDLLDAFLRKEDLDEKISDVMVRDVIFCNYSESIGFVLTKLKFSRRGGFPVVDGKRRVIGLVSERDFVWLFDKVKFGIKVRDIMTRKPFFVQNSISIYDCLRIMINTRYRRLPVMSNNRLVGIVTSLDLLRYIVENNFSLDALDEDLAFVYKTDVYVINEEADLSDAIRLMKDKDVGGIIVIEDKKLEGIITERDILGEIE